MEDEKIPPCIIQVAFDISNPFNAVPLDVLEGMVGDQEYLDALTTVAQNYLCATHFVRKEMERKHEGQLFSILSRVEKKLDKIIGEDDTWSVASSDSTRSGDPEEYEPLSTPRLTRQYACDFDPTQYVESPEWPGYDSE